MGAGYTMDVQQTMTAGTALSDDTSFATSAKYSVNTMSVPGDPEAGDGIGSTLKAFQSGWDHVLGKVVTEMKAMSEKVISTKNVTVTVEEQVRDRFHKFAI